MARRDDSLLTLRSTLVLALADAVGVLIGLAQGLGPGVLAGLVAAGLLHTLLGR